MKVVTAAEMAALDQRTIREHGLPGAVLMETAGRALAEACARHGSGARRVLVFCGPGNNGGDGFVAARTLARQGWETRCELLGEPGRLVGDAALHAEVYRRMGGSLAAYPGGGARSVSGFRPDLVVDALFGTGLRRPLEGRAREAVEEINRSGLPVVSADVPSGVCSDTGRILGDAVRARVTVTMGLPKRGLLLHPGAGCAGTLEVAEIGFPRADLEDPGLPGHLLEADGLRGLLPSRPPTAHKGSCGMVLVVGGSRSYLGAPSLASEAALRVGAGLVLLACPAEIRGTLAGWMREILTLPLPSPRGTLDVSDLDSLLPVPERVRALCVGPGLAGDEETHEAVRNLVARTSVPAVLDADALRAVAGRGPLRPGLVLTPHPGEMAALTGVSVSDLESDRVAHALACAARYRAVVVMKGAPTVIAAADGRTYWINPTGGPVLAQGGTGDVLAGALAGFLAQGLEPAEAACAAVFLHGLAGEACAARLGSRGVLAGEIARALPGVLEETLGSGRTGLVAGGNAADSHREDPLR